MDADITIIKTALTAAKDATVNVFADDTNILSLLIHVTDILNDLENHVIKYLLFAHAFTGCDTRSAIHNLGKTSMFKKPKDSIALTNTGDVFYEEFKTPQEIGNTCIHFFERMYSPFD